MKREAFDARTFNEHAFAAALLQDPRQVQDVPATLRPDHMADENVRVIFGEARKVFAEYGDAATPEHLQAALLRRAGRPDAYPIMDISFPVTAGEHGEVLLLGVVRRVLEDAALVVEFPEVGTEATQNLLARYAEAMSTPSAVRVRMDPSLASQREAGTAEELARAEAAARTAEELARVEADAARDAKKRAPSPPADLLYEDVIVAAVMQHPSWIPEMPIRSKGVQNRQMRAAYEAIEAVAGYSDGPDHAPMTVNPATVAEQLEFRARAFESQARLDGKSDQQIWEGLEGLHQPSIWTLRYLWEEKVTPEKLQTALNALAERAVREQRSLAADTLRAKADRLGRPAALVQLGKTYMGDVPGVADTRARLTRNPAATAPQEPQAGR